MLIRRLTWLGVVIGAVGGLAVPLMDADLWWHIVVGRWISAMGTLPQVDYWNSFAVGKPWRAYSWSNDLVYAWVEQGWGLEGLLVLQTALALSLTLVLALVFGTIARSKAFGLLLTLPVLFCIHSHFALRPQSFTWILFALLILVSLRICSRGLGWRDGCALAVLGCLWANSHLSAVLGIIAVGGMMASDCLVARAQRELLIVVLLLFFSTLVTPYFGGEWLSLFETARHPLSYTSIAEFSPGHFQQPVVLGYLMMLVVLAIFLHYRPRSLSPSQLASLVLFSVLGLGIVKFLPYAAILCGSCIARIWGLTEGRPALLGELGLAIERGLGRTLQPGSALLILLFSGVAGGIRLTQLLSKPPTDQTAFPSAAVDYFLANKLPVPVLNGFNEGGYLIYRFSDDAGLPLIRVALDGRTDVNDHKVFRAFEKAFNGIDGWQEFFSFVKPNTVIWHNALPLGAILENGGEWRRVFGNRGERSGWSVFVKKGLSNTLSHDSSVDSPTPRARLSEAVDVRALTPITQERRDYDLVERWITLNSDLPFCAWQGIPETTQPLSEVRGVEQVREQRELIWTQTSSRVGVMSRRSSPGSGRQRTGDPVFGREFDHP